MEKLLYPLASLTSWRIGGVADRFYMPVDLSDLVNYINNLSPIIPFTWLGLGSNVLIRDGGIRGVVIATRQLQDLAHLSDGTICGQAGLTCAKLARFCSRLGFSDAAFFAGIPGTLGGALAMNAGAFGGETWKWVKSVKVVNRQGECIDRTPEDYHIAYRTVQGKKPEQASEAFVEATFQFPLRSDKNGLDEIRTLLRKRAESQPIGTWNCGSVYRNPPGDFAARLIEAAGLKGARMGDAMVSEKHANFIINCHQARASEVEALMEKIEKTIFERFGVILTPEVKILGER